MAPLGKAREEIEHVGNAEDMPAHGVRGRTHEAQILIDRQIDKDVLAFGHQRQAAGHPLMRRQAFNAPVLRD